MSLVYPNWPSADRLLHQYMFGDYLLVGAFTEEITLPAGRWIDAWTGRTMDGGQTIEAAYPAHAGGALLIKEGAIIPTWAARDSIETSTMEEVALNIYPSLELNRFDLYEDDGESKHCEAGEYASTAITALRRDAQTIVAIGPRLGHFEGQTAVRRYQLKLYGLRGPCSATVNGQPVSTTIRSHGWSGPVESGVVCFEANAEPGRELHIVVKETE